MTDFAPPRGQRCETCLCFDPAVPESCFGFPSAPRPRVIQWCGAWRPNRDTRCGACGWFRQGECPKTATIEVIGEPRNTKYFVQPCETAFACTRFEENAT